MFELFWTHQSEADFNVLKLDPAQNKHYKAILKTIKLLAANPRHPGLQTHEFTSLKAPQGEKVFEAYAEQNTPAAYRVFWYYGPDKGQITIFAITKHP